MEDFGHELTRPHSLVRDRHVLFCLRALLYTPTRHMWSNIHRERESEEEEEEEEEGKEEEES